ncbi:hypothetical protein CROQUDRAFT_38796 [Cronartium quercuum f. sp. fusiforme G11]|uniref:WLM domain-containing protein n=1 Tax=Cronartium quercuum f. sp. fusiforme G11 TaxID=708437 RepID=A0A9P6TFT7_9BASI|nr:hypothetical protein CROQUDRAFT_38796 [Cronartium quercuum f. sp. fusiforme G11]
MSFFELTPKPIMKDHRMGLNSFTEYQWNTEFAGRNPMGYLLSVMAHELAHIHERPQFQKLNAQLSYEIQALQARGYYGPGFWSSGQRLKDGASRVGDGALAASDLPQYTCGGSKAYGSGRRIYRPKTITSGRGNKQANQFVGAGRRLESAGQMFFRKRTTTKSAKEARAQAAELRVQAVCASRPTISKPATSNSNSNPASQNASSSRNTISSSSKDSSSRNSVPNCSGTAKEETEQDEEIEIIELESEWEDFDPSLSITPTQAQVEEEKLMLREEMQHLVKDYHTQQTKKKANRTEPPKGTERPGKQMIVLDDDEIEVVHASTKVKRKHGEEEVGTLKLPRPTLEASTRTCSRSSILPHAPLKAMASTSTATLTESNPSPPKLTLRPIEPLACSWKCQVCCTENHADFARCSSCARPKGLPPPNWR